MKIRFDAPVAVRLEFQAGDEVDIAVVPSHLEQLLHSGRLDGVKVARVVGGKPSRTVANDEVTEPETATRETTTADRGRTRAHRPATVSE